MANAFNANKVFNGTNGKVYIGDTEMAEAISLEAKVTLDKQEVNSVGVSGKQYKVVGMEGKGTIKLNKVSSFFIKGMSDAIKQNKQPEDVTIHSYIGENDAGEDATGSQEEVVLKGVQFDELPLINWETKKLGEESIGFTFTDYEVKGTVTYADEKWGSEN